MAFKKYGREVSNIGFGLLGLSWRPQAVSDDDALAAMRAAVEAGCTYWNAGEFYGTPERNSVTLMGKYFERYPDDAAKVVVNIKGCLVNFQPDGSPAGVKRSIDTCLSMLGDHGCLVEFEPARKDPKVDIETTVAAIEEYVKAGKISGVSLSEVSADTLRRAATVTKISALEVELSLWSTEPLTNGLVKTCAELDIPILAYSPLGRGFLTGAIKSPDDLPEGDFRRTIPRFQAGAFETNMRLVREVEKLAASKGCTPAQIAINWLLTLSQRPGMPRIIPIPGASAPERVRENSKEIALTSEDMAELDRLITTLLPVGDRYPPMGMKLLDG